MPVTPVTRVPFVPWKIAPPSAGKLAPSSRSTGRGGCIPSYQLSFTGGRLPRAGNWNVTTAASGCTSLVEPQQVASMLEGAVSFSAVTTESSVCTPRSPIMPQPKSHQHRQVEG